MAEQIRSTFDRLKASIRLLEENPALSVVFGQYHDGRRRERWLKIPPVLGSEAPLPRATIDPKSPTVGLITVYGNSLESALNGRDAFFQAGVECSEKFDLAMDQGPQYSSVWSVAFQIVLPQPKEGVETLEPNYSRRSFL